MIFDVEGKANSYFEAEIRANPQLVVHHYGDTVSWIKFTEHGALSLAENMDTLEFLHLLKEWDSELLERVFRDYVEHLAGRYDLVIQNVIDARRRNERRELPFTTD